MFWLTSCQEKAKEEQTEKSEAAKPIEMDKLLWLVGEWQNQSPDGVYTEKWEKVSDSLLSGKSSFVKGKDTLSSEQLKLRYINGVLCYLPTVKNQNQGQEVKFKLSTISDKEAKFENPQHDFPQQISYTRLTPDSAVAEISGKINGESRSEKFPLKRVK